LSVPIIAHYQPTPVVQPAVGPLHLPTPLADLMDLRRSPWPAPTVGPLTARDRRADTSTPQLTPKLSAIVPLISSQAIRALPGTPSGAWHPPLVHYLRPHCHLGHMSSRYHESQGPSLTLCQHVDRRTLTFPTLGYVFSPFLAGTKLPFRACLRSWHASQPTDHEVDHGHTDHGFAGLG